jgi:hypothetical protein
MERPVFRLVVDNTGTRGATPPRPPRRREPREPLLREAPASREQIAQAMANIRRILDMEPQS